MATDRPCPPFGLASSIQSVFHIHTETHNIWTRLLGFVLFVAFGNPDHAQSDQICTSWPPGRRRWFSGWSSWAPCCSWLSRRLLSFRDSLSGFFQTGLFRACSTAYGELCPPGRSLLFLLPTATAHLLLRHLCPGHFHHHCGPVGPVCHS